MGQVRNADAGPPFIPSGAEMPSADSFRTRKLVGQRSLRDLGPPYVGRPHHCFLGCKATRTARPVFPRRLASKLGDTLLATGLRRAQSSRVNRWDAIPF